MIVVKGLVVLVSLLVLGFVAWLTGGSFPAFIATVLLLGFTGIWGAVVSGIMPMPFLARTIFGSAAVLCLVVVVGMSIGRWREKPEASTHGPGYEATRGRTPMVAEPSSIGKVPTLYEFSDFPHDTIVVRVNDYGSHSYPKGGCVRIFPPGGGSFVDCPGINTTTTRGGPGVWKWYPVDENATGVEVWDTPRR